MNIPSVLLILNKLGVDYKEQIAGLLHDISHKSFSHVYDWIVKDHTVSGDKEEAQDDLHKIYIRKSSLTLC
jgi:HD superfamily phosphohydrolase